ncbi:hypothetical protein A8C32_08280 [Flavivirga aquatica]|uniref:Uncharacterized protein n=1 Tax=Flavivirga aquatica TaxID=1849968 RepID=A0A1E5SJ76_9FLAO|nr:hypothetical protein [Flavivirga aquatica]OEJ99161.1 hypothetical protein A8C32_08280 [Flavivirga aquatica]
MGKEVGEYLKFYLKNTGTNFNELFERFIDNKIFNLKLSDSRFEIESINSELIIVGISYEWNYY